MKSLKRNTQKCGKESKRARQLNLILMKRQKTRLAMKTRKRKLMNKLKKTLRRRGRRRLKQRLRRKHLMVTSMVSSNFKTRLTKQETKTFRRLTKNWH